MAEKKVRQTDSQTAKQTNRQNAHIYDKKTIAPTESGTITRGIDLKPRDCNRKTAGARDVTVKYFIRRSLLKVLVYGQENSMAVHLFCLSTGGGVPLFTRTHGDAKAVSYGNK